MVAPFERNAAVLVKQFVIGAVPVRIGDDGARRADDIAQRIDEHVGTVEQPPQSAHGGMNHDHVAGAKSELFQILAERETGMKVRSGHRPTISRTRPGVNAPGRTQGTIARNTLLPLTRLVPPRPRRASVWCTAFKDMNLVDPLPPIGAP